MELIVNSLNNNQTHSLSVSEIAFDAEFKEGLVHQVVTAYLAGGRAGTKAQKTRSEVSGGGAKPWRQKGTGRARAGTIRSPLWRTGGVTFAAKPRDYTQKVNRKMYQRAMSSIISELVRQNRLTIVDELTLPEPKTSQLKILLNKLDFNKGLILLADENPVIYLAARNLPFIDVLDAEIVDPVHLISAERIIATVEAIRKLEERVL